MKLNLDVIADYLPEHYQVRRYGSKERRLLCGRPRLYDLETALEDGRVYITASDFLQEPMQEGMNMICVGGKFPKHLLRDGAQALHIENNTDVMQVLWDVQAVYDRFDAWNDKLRDILEASGEPDMEQFFLTGINILKNRIGLSDYGLHPMFNCNMEDGKPHFHDMRDGHSAFDMTNLEGIRDVGLVEREIQVPYLSAIPNVSTKNYCQNIYSFGRYMGCAYFTNDVHPFRESDYPLMDHFFNYLCKMALRYFSTTSTGDSLETAIIRDILNSRIPQGARLRQVRLAPGESWLCLRARERQGARYLPHNYMCEQLRMLLPGRVHVLQYGDGIVGILHRAADPSDNPEADFEELLQRMGYICGLSNPFRELSLFPHFYEQASFALESFMESDSSETISRFGENILRYMLSACTGTMPKGVLYPAGLLRLVEHDLQKGSDYVRTLRVYLNSECNASRTADQLYVHRNSFLKRLERITRILEMDLEDADTRLLLRICLKLLESTGT